MSHAARSGREARVRRMLERYLDDERWAKRLGVTSDDGGGGGGGVTGASKAPCRSDQIRSLMSKKSGCRAATVSSEAQYSPSDPF